MIPQRVEVWADRRGHHGWRPGIWIRTIEHGRQKGLYVVVIGREIKERYAQPDNVRPWSDTYGKEKDDGSDSRS